MTDTGLTWTVEIEGWTASLGAPSHYPTPCRAGACKRPGTCTGRVCEAAYWQPVLPAEGFAETSAAPAGAGEGTRPRLPIADDPGGWFDGLRQVV